MVLNSTTRSFLGILALFIVFLIGYYFEDTGRKVASFQEKKDILFHSFSNGVSALFFLVFMSIRLGLLTLSVKLLSNDSGLAKSYFFLDLAFIFILLLIGLLQYFFNVEILRLLGINYSIYKIVLSPILILLFMPAYYLKKFMPESSN